MYALGYQHLEFWRKHRILSDKTIARMKEAQLTSDLVIAMNAGLQDKKDSINKYYERWDDRVPYKRKTVDRFHDIIDIVDQQVGGDLKDSAFRRPPLFYSLFLAIYERRYGRLGAEQQSKQQFGEREALALRAAITRLSDVLKQGEPPRAFATFVTACQRQTDNIAPRRTRLETILKEMGK